MWLFFSRTAQGAVMLPFSTYTGSVFSSLCPVVPQGTSPLCTPRSAVIYLSQVALSANSFSLLKSVVWSKNKREHAYNHPDWEYFKMTCLITCRQVSNSWYFHAQVLQVTDQGLRCHRELLVTLLLVWQRNLSVDLYWGLDNESIYFEVTRWKCVRQ